MKHKKLLSLLLAVVLCLSLMGTALAADPAPEAEEIILLHTNDVHGEIQHYSTAAALKDFYEAQGAYVLLLDAGDFIQGGPTVNLSKGATAVELMGLAGYDAAALGNHEFDFGFEVIKGLEQQASFPMLAANVLFEGKPAFRDRMVFTSPAGTKLGVFALATPETATKAHPAKIQGLTFLGQSQDEDLIRCAQEQVDALRAEGCDLVICLSHLGTDAESTGHRSTDVLAQVNGIDLMIDGHSNTTLEEVRAMTGGTGILNGAYLTSTGSRLESIGKVTILDGKITQLEELPTDSLDLIPQAAAEQRAQEILREIDALYGTVLAQSEVLLDGEESHVRSHETNFADLVSDAMLWKVRGLGHPADVAIFNGGNLRNPLPAGPITRSDLLTAMPFQNDLCLVKLTGAELAQVLEVSTFCTPAPIGGFPHVAGMSLTVNTAVPFQAGEQYPNSTYHRPASVNRVAIQSVGGQPFDPDKTYTIVTNDFLAMGGDTYYLFSQADYNVDLGLSLEEAVMEYVSQALDGVITAQQYGASDSRLVQIQSPAALRTYTVQSGDSLWKIAQRAYGKGAQWGRIYDANRSVIRADYTIFPGQVLTIPAVSV